MRRFLAVLTFALAVVLGHGAFGAAGAAPGLDEDFALSGLPDTSSPQPTPSEDDGCPSSPEHSACCHPGCAPSFALLRNEAVPRSDDRPMTWLETAARSARWIVPKLDPPIPKPLA